MSQTSAGRPELEAVRLLLERMGISPADLLQVRPARPPAPTFAEYAPVVAAAESPGTRRAYGSYRNRVIQAWGDRRIDEPLPSEIEQLRSQVQANAVARRNPRGRRSAAEYLVAALRCLYSRGGGRRIPGRGRHPGVEGGQPAAAAAPWRCARATWTPTNARFFLRELGGTFRWQPVSPTLMRHLLAHPAERGHGDRDLPLLRYRDGRPLTHRRRPRVEPVDSGAAPRPRRLRIAPTRRRRP